jgi:ABC-2 type transport system ATP-binding protein
VTAPVLAERALTHERDDPPLLQLNDVRKRYGAFEALAGITLTLSPGRIGLLGPNGAGKSTLLKALLGLLPFTGSAAVLGLDPRTDAKRLRARIGYMPEHQALPPGMTAVELCAFGAELSGLPRGEALQRAHSVLEFVGLGDKRYQHLDGYSTGMKQRVGLAQALVHDPRLVLLDEPTNGLDPAGREEVLALVRSLPERTGCAVLLSSHLLPDVEQTCEQAILLHEGQVLYAGSIGELRQAGQEHLYEVRIKETEPAAVERFERALSTRRMSCEREGAFLIVRVAPDDPRPTAGIFAAAEEAAVQVRHLQPRKLTLERAFLRAVGEPRRGAVVS